MNNLGLNDYEKLVDDYVIASTTDLDGIITHASNLFCKMTGYTKEELIGKPHSLIRHPDMARSIFKDMWDTIQSGNIWRGEVQNLTKDGNYYWVESVVSPIINENGETIGYKSFRFDITYKKALELRTQESEALSNTLQTFLMDENFNIEDFNKIIKRRDTSPIDNINYIEPELWV